MHFNEDFIWQGMLLESKNECPKWKLWYLFVGNVFVDFQTNAYFSFKSFYSKKALDFKDQRVI